MNQIDVILLIIIEAEAYGVRRRLILGHTPLIHPLSHLVLVELAARRLPPQYGITPSSANFIILDHISSSTTAPTPIFVSWDYNDKQWKNCLTIPSR